MTRIINLSDLLTKAGQSSTSKKYDTVVVGGGIAGLCYALNVAPTRRVALLTKGVFGESNTRYAQGGIAAAVGNDDSPELHYNDTLIAGAGLCDPEAVRILVEEAPAGIEWLIQAGTNFDRHGPELDLGMEGAHSRRRILHAQGDATGAEIERALVATVRARQNIDVFEGAFALDLLLDQTGLRTEGILAREDKAKELTIFEAPLVVLANGGLGQLWRTTSNPGGATGDGLAMAYRAGAELQNLEFMQFHPTVLHAPDAPTFLISEAVRGEGAYLRNARGERFMPAYHPQAELAPRDVVARAILTEMKRCDAPSVFLDLSHLDPALVAAHFPTIGEACRAANLNLATDLIPVAPAAHYYMGGISVDQVGQTSLNGLYALGEVSCTGVHGANRLASNSLLEGLVWGLRAAKHTEEIWPVLSAKHDQTNLFLPADNLLQLRNSAGKDYLPWENIQQQLKEIMSNEVSLYRTASGLNQAAEEVKILQSKVDPAQNARAWETRNMLLTAELIIAAASCREESRGGHYRLDFPDTELALAKTHYIFQIEHKVERKEELVWATR